MDIRAKLKHLTVNGVAIDEVEAEAQRKLILKRLQFSLRFCLIIDAMRKLLNESQVNAVRQVIEVGFE